MYSLTDQIRRASRSIGGQIAEAWGKRRYQRHFISKLTDADGEQLQAQHWIETALDCKYLQQEKAEYLLQKGFRNITLIDISNVLIDKLKLKFETSEIKLIRSDFFEHTGRYDLIIEQTFFCALDPKSRKMYAEKVKTLLDKKGKLAGVLFYNNDPENELSKENDGPPFISSLKEYKKVFNENFNIIKMEECYNSISPRMGKELFINLKLK